MRLLLLSLSLMILSTSCIKDHDITPDCHDSSREKMDRMNLTDLKLGQKFRYILFTANGYRSEDSINFTYTGDTLELEVVNVSGREVTVTERITDGSRMKNTSVDYYWTDVDSVYTNYWKIENDLLMVESKQTYLRSHIVYNPYLPLEKFKDQEVEVRGWKTSYPYNESDTKLFARAYSLLGHQYSHINIYINNSPMQVDGPGNTTFYGKDCGIIRTSTYSWWTGSGIGWDRL